MLRAGLFLEVTCRGCGRRSVFASGGFFGLVSGATRLDRLAARMRCEGSPHTGKGCGHRGSEITAISWPPTKPAPLPPKPLASLAPRGIDQTECDKAVKRRVARSACTRCPSRLRKERAYTQLMNVRKWAKAAIQPFPSGNHDRDGRCRFAEDGVPGMPECARERPVLLAHASRGCEALGLMASSSRVPSRLQKRLPRQT